MSIRTRWSRILWSHSVIREMSNILNLEMLTMKSNAHGTIVRGFFILCASCGHHDAVMLHDDVWSQKIIDHLLPNHELLLRPLGPEVENAPLLLA